MRLRVPEGQTIVEDVIRGTVTFENETIDDFVIARSDGSPLYNLAVAVDDRDMEITHVVRGEDHLSNTPRQLMVIEALGIDHPPIYAHLPLMHGPGWQEALQAPRCGLGPGAARRRLPAGGGPQLHRAARLGLSTPNRPSSPPRR